jgi:hypothetical protein
MNIRKWFESNVEGFRSSIDKSFSGLNKELEGLGKFDIGSPDWDQLNINTDQDLSPFVKGAVVITGTGIGAVEGFLVAGPYGAYAGAAAGAEVAQNVNQNIFGSRYVPDKDGGEIQKAVIGTTGDIQREAVNIGKGIQQATIVNTSDLQERAVDWADRNDLGKNPTLEKWAKEITHSTEEGAAEVTKWAESNIAGATAEAKKGAEQVTTFAENTADAVSDIYDLLTGSVPDPEGVGGGATTYEPTESDMNPLDDPSIDDPFDTIEKGTEKDDALSEEEKLRKIRRLLLNRYGREDTILTGTADPTNRRRYAL